MSVNALVEGGSVVADDDEGDCRTCNGQGGWWEFGNGQPNVAKPKRWIKCWDCSGKGKK